MSTQPRLPERELRRILVANNVDQSVLSVIAIRGFHLDSMGVKGKNDRMMYDDAHFIVWPDGVAAYVGNTDPNGYRKGRGFGAEKGMAMVKAGIHIYGTGKHKGTLAFRQCEKFTVIRDGIDGDYEDLGWHATNWHAGGNVFTSSLGCQTNPRDLFVNEIRPQVYHLLERFNNPKRKNDHGELVRSFNYVLIEETERRAGNLIVSRRYL